MRDFNVGDAVTAPSSSLWMTVTEVLPHGFVRCRFGSMGCDAGSFRPSELRSLAPTEHGSCTDCGLSGPADELERNLCPRCAEAEQKSAGENLNWRGSL